MVFLIGLILAIIFLDWPWRALILIPLALFELLEVTIWLRLRRARAITGAEAMVGTKGVALTNCEPEGQVRVKGQTWNALCRKGVRAGEQVVVMGTSGIRLEVERAAPDDEAARSWG